MDAPLTLDQLKTAIRQGPVDVETNTVGGFEMSSWERPRGFERL